MASLFPEVPFSPQNIYKEGWGEGNCATEWWAGEWGSAKMRLAQGEFLRKAQFVWPRGPERPGASSKLAARLRPACGSGPVSGRGAQLLGGQEQAGGRTL